MHGHGAALQHSLGGVAPYPTLLTPLLSSELPCIPSTRPSLSVELAFTSEMGAPLFSRSCLMSAVWLAAPEANSLRVAADACVELLYPRC